MIMCSGRAVWAAVLFGLVATRAGQEGLRVGAGSDVFVGGEVYPAYRIPAIVRTPVGTLLAFAEGRGNKGDHSGNDLVLRRSLDGGRSWRPLQVVASDGANALNNPTAVVLPPEGRVMLMFQRYAEGYDEHRAAPGYDDPRTCRTWVQESSDDGCSWSAPRDVTREVKRPEATSTATGPGVGIVLRSGPHRGRVVMPFNEGPYGRWRVYTAYSDDRGMSWQRGERAPDDGQARGNECQVAELADGTLMLNARVHGGRPCRQVAFSRDGGESWSPLQNDLSLVEPTCQASLLAVPRPGAVALWFSNPASTTARTNGTLRLSDDGGRHWRWALVIHPGSFGYSCLVELGEGEVGCLFEKDDYDRITFVRVQAAELVER